MNTPDFKKLIERVRIGDADAAAELVHSFESDLRIIARVKLSDPRMRRLIDSMDICQSIMGNFFVRASAGQFEMETPDQLRKLLVSMIKNKVIDHARRQTAGQRDQRRIESHQPEDLPLVANQDTPSQIASAKELAALVRKQLTHDELEIVDRRINGCTWDEIAAELNASPEAIRKKMTRALDRAAKAVGLDEV